MMPPPGAPTVEIVYHRPPTDVERYRQELLHDGDNHKITLSYRTLAAEAQVVSSQGATAAEASDEASEHPAARAVATLWFTFPGRWYEVAAMYARDGRLRGYYTNIIRPPDLEPPGVWHMTDLFLDVWQPKGGRPALLDEDDLEAARREGAIEADDAEGAEGEARRVLDRARRGRWPPRLVRRWPLEAVSSLRFRRDAPGTYYANLVSTRVIAYGLYVLGTVSLTSVFFAAFTDAFLTRGGAQTAWLITMGAEAVLLLPFALAGVLPATERARPAEAMTERTLFLGALVTGLAVLLLNRSELWRDLLAAVYASLAFFTSVFTLCRGVFDRKVSYLGIAGILVCILALIVLL